MSCGGNLVFSRGYIQPKQVTEDKAWIRQEKGDKKGIEIRKRKLAVVKQSRRDALLRLWGRCLLRRLLLTNRRRPDRKVDNTSVGHLNLSSLRSGLML